ncbi:multidrug transporter [Flammeovirga aprica]|uniref:Multidrug transporter n=1 Tax=Flammeovirga aprica JL-4 TaxID=694437 RepID=A0A7X9P3V7_9BACT|nr:multidrug transporter [Flammeovirga aprica]NME68112.1 multidrug transporter [Flammeovirga aprica JL-4]
MKKQFRYAIVVASLAVSLGSCSDDNTTTPDNPTDSLQDSAYAAKKIVAVEGATGFGETIPSWAKEASYAGTVVDISNPSETLAGGSIDADKTLEGVVVLAGPVTVASGVTLTIKAGTQVVATENDSYLMVLQGGKIMAEGTAENMIVFTSGQATQAPGDWGGILINGKAPINNGDANGQANNEVASGVMYGGTVADDNSGVLKYVRVEFTGYKYDSESEHNGFTFSGVGSGTQLSYLQAFKGSDDGLEWFGGTVSGTDLVSVGNEDDSFDWAHGFVGSLTNLWVEHDAARDHDKAFEIDNNSKDNSATPYSNATVKNVTVMGQSGETTAFRVREGAKGSFSNILVKNAKKGFDIHNDVTIRNVLSDELTVSNYSIEDVASEVEYVDDSE